MKRTRLAVSDVDAYLRALPADMRSVLTKLRRAIRSAAPGAEELISYQMPAYRQDGPLVYFAAFKDHCSLFPASKSILKRFAAELSGFDASGGTIRFTPARPLPGNLVRRIVSARVKENASKRAARTTKGGK
jgi:uncharacterized protein YdhG (YjbR/CyaY superfamily)